MKGLLLQLGIWTDGRGQDLIEYALMAGFVAVAATATFPNIAISVSQIFSKVGSALVQANGS
jgi:Flp pilus assembly pilin Flp